MKAVVVVDVMKTSMVWVSVRVSVVDATVIVDTSVTITRVVDDFGVTVFVGVVVECTVTVDVVLLVAVLLGTGESAVGPNLVVQISVSLYPDAREHHRRRDQSTEDRNETVMTVNQRMEQRGRRTKTVRWRFVSMVGRLQHINISTRSHPLMAGPVDRSMGSQTSITSHAMWHASGPVYEQEAALSAGGERQQGSAFITVECRRRCSYPTVPLRRRHWLSTEAGGTPRLAKVS